MLARSDDAASFAENLWQLYQHPQLGQELSPRGRQTILESYSNLPMEQEFLKLAS